MSDQELRRYGLAAKSMCSPEANFDNPPRQTFVIQLAEARAEWDRRKVRADRRERLYDGWGTIGVRPFALDDAGISDGENYSNHVRGVPQLKLIP
jgi:hypothetical protein